MKYNGPVGIPEIVGLDTEGNLVYIPYINGNRDTQTLGSIPPAAAVEYPQREIINFLTKNLITPSSADLFQMCKATQNSTIIYAAATGDANTLRLALDPAPQAHVGGMTIRIKKGPLDNTGAVTLDFGLGPKPVVTVDGGNLANGDLPGSSTFEVTYDGVINKWVLTNFFGVDSTTSVVTNNYATLIPYCVDTGTSNNHIIAPFSPAITALTAGNLILVKLNRGFVGGATDIKVNALATTPVIRGDSAQPLAGDGFLGQVLLLEFDGTNFQIINSTIPSKPLPVILGDNKPYPSTGGTFTAGAWRTRDLNTVLSDPFGLVASGLVTLANNQITLVAGKWFIEAICPVASVRYHQHRLWSVTDSAQVIKGAHVAGFLEDQFQQKVSEYGFVDGYLNITSTKTYQIQGICTISCTGTGFGFNVSPWDETNFVDTYTRVKILKVG